MTYMHFRITVAHSRRLNIELSKVWLQRRPIGVESVQEGDHISLLEGYWQLLKQKGGFSGFASNYYYYCVTVILAAGWVDSLSQWQTWAIDRVTAICVTNFCCCDCSQCQAAVMDELLGDLQEVRSSLLHSVSLLFLFCFHITSKWLK